MTAGVRQCPGSCCCCARVEGAAFLLRGSEPALPFSMLGPCPGLRREGVAA